MQKSKEKQKKFLGTVPKKCQLVETFWDCPEISKTNNKGITLIALIITIIVMLILVGVTINVALSGGLFINARTGTQETEEQAILEEMLGMVEITDEGYFNPEAIISKMREKYTVEYNKPNAKITGKLGTYNYVVSETEIRIGEEKDIEVDIFTTQILNGTNIRITGLIKPEGVTTIAIPATLEYEGKTYNVTEIGDKAFAGVIIPDGYSAEDIANLDKDSEEFNQIANSQSDYKDIQNIDFSNATNLEKIGEMSFAGLKQFTTIVLPTNLKTIGKGAFGITAITGKIEFNSTLETIDNYAFWGSIGITEIAYNGESLETIGQDAFFECTSLSQVTFNCNSLKTIGAEAFYGCTSLTGEITIPNSVITIGNGAFHGCTNLTGIIDIPSSIKTIGNSAFSGCTRLSGVTFNGDSLEKIGYSAFSECTNLSGEINIPSSVTEIGSSAFMNTSISKLIINNSEGVIERSTMGTNRR